MPCTTLLVGKKATYDGSTLMGRNEDSPSGTFNSKKFIVVNPNEQPRHYKSVLTKFEVDLPDNPMRYTATPNAVPDEGIWGTAGINEENIAMSATETINSNPRVVGADPIFEDGLGEEDMVTIVLPYIHSAREGVERLGKLIEDYGTCEMNGIGFQDVDEIWWFESVGGHHWMAKRVPDDSYVVMPNQLGIDSLDLKDAFGEKKDNMCSSDMLSFIRDNFLDLGLDDTPLEEKTDFKPRLAFSESLDGDHVYNTCRAWDMARHLNPNTYLWDGEFADYTPYSDDIPWSFVPERKLTVEDVKETLSRYYQGTQYNPYNKKEKSEEAGKLRVIGINRNNTLSITQLRPYMPSEIMAIQWYSVGSNAFNASVPFYTNVKATPAYIANSSARVTTEDFYWTNRIIGALCDSRYAETVAHVERYQFKVISTGRNMVREFDRKFIEEKPDDVCAYLGECNQKISDMAQKETDDLLDKVLYSVSCKMNNAFFRSDN